MHPAGQHICAPEDQAIAVHARCNIFEGIVCVFQTNAKEAKYYIRSMLVYVCLWYLVRLIACVPERTQKGARYRYRCERFFFCWVTYAIRAIEQSARTKELLCIYFRPKEFCAGKIIYTIYLGFGLVRRKLNWVSNSIVHCVRSIMLRRCCDLYLKI